MKAEEFSSIQIMFISAALVIGQCHSVTVSSTLSFIRNLTNQQHVCMHVSVFTDLLSLFAIQHRWTHVPTNKCAMLSHGTDYSEASFAEEKPLSFSPRLLSLVRWPTLRKVLVLSVFFSCGTMEATVLLGNFSNRYLGI